MNNLLLLEKQLASLTLSGEQLNSFIILIDKVRCEVLRGEV